MAAKKAVVEAARQSGTASVHGALLRPPLVPHAPVHHGMAVAGSNAGLGRAGKFVGEIAASLAAKGLLDRALETETASRVMERTRNSPTTRKLVASASQNKAGSAVLGRLQRTQLSAALPTR